MAAERRRLSDSEPPCPATLHPTQGTEHVRRRNNPPREPAGGNGILVADGENKREVRLRNGALHDVGLVNGAMLFFRGLSEHKPDHFRILLEMIEGRGVTSSPEALRELREAGVVAADGTMRPLFRDVLQSACRETPEGLVIASPFSPRDEAEAAFIGAHVAAFDDRVVRFARKYHLGGPPPGSDRGL
jgi:hypothetical protein